MQELSCLSNNAALFSFMQSAVSGNLVSAEPKSKSSISLSQIFTGLAKSREFPLYL